MVCSKEEAKKFAKGFEPGFQYLFQAISFYLGKRSEALKKLKELKKEMSSLEERLANPKNLIQDKVSDNLNSGGGGKRGRNPNRWYRQQSLKFLKSQIIKETISEEPISKEELETALRSNQNRIKVRELEITFTKEITIYFAGLVLIFAYQILYYHVQAEITKCYHDDRYPINSGGDRLSRIELIKLGRDHAVHWQESDHDTPRSRYSETYRGLQTLKRHHTESLKNSQQDSGNSDNFLELFDIQVGEPGNDSNLSNFSLVILHYLNWIDSSIISPDVPSQSANAGTSDTNTVAGELTGKLIADLESFIESFEPPAVSENDRNLVAMTLPLQQRVKDIRDEFWDCIVDFVRKLSHSQSTKSELVFYKVLPDTETDTGTYKLKIFLSGVESMTMTPSNIKNALKESDFYNEQEIEDIPDASISVDNISTNHYNKGELILDIKLNNTSQSDLREKDLTDANLSGANLSNADLTGTNLIGTNLSNADFSGAKLSRVTFQNQQVDERIRIKLDRAKLCQVTLWEVKLNSGNLRHVSLENSKFIDIEFCGADLSHGDLRGANFIDCDFGGADLSHGDLGGANFIDCNFGGADLSHGDLREANFIDCDFGGADLTDVVNSSNAKFFNCKFKSVTLNPSDLRNAMLNGVNFIEEYNRLYRTK